MTMMMIMIIKDVLGLRVLVRLAFKIKLIFNLITFFNGFFFVFFAIITGSYFFLTTILTAVSVCVWQDHHLMIMMASILSKILCVPF